MWVLPQWFSCQFGGIIIIPSMFHCFKVELQNWRPRDVGPVRDSRTYVPLWCTCSTISTLVGIWLVSIFIALVNGGFNFYSLQPLDLNLFEDKIFGRTCFILQIHIVTVHSNPYILLFAELGALTFGLIYSARTIIILKNWKLPGEQISLYKTVYEKRKLKSQVIIVLILFAFMCWIPPIVFYMNEAMMYGKGTEVLWLFIYFVCWDCDLVNVFCCDQSNCVLVFGSDFSSCMQNNYLEKLQNYTLALFQMRWYCTYC